jgi:hypothetical protein
MSWKEVPFPSCCDTAEFEEQIEALRAENDGLREQVAEVEGWYRLLQADHAALQARHGRCGREAVALRGELNRLELEAKQWQDIVARQQEAAAHREEASPMKRFWTAARQVAQHKLAVVAVVAFGTLLARDPWIGGLIGAARDRAVEAFRGREAVGTEADGYLRYAAMINARDAAEQARRAYNEREAELMGDALLEAQDRLRSAKTRDREARLAFLPVLARRCQAANVPMPAEAAVALAELNAESSR